MSSPTTPSPLVTALARAPPEYWSSMLAPSSLYWTRYSGWPILAAHGHEVALLRPAVGLVRPDGVQDGVAGIERGKLVPERVELGIADLALAVVVEFLMVNDETLEFADASRLLSRHGSPFPHSTHRR
jgi:hypothetical protein